MATLEQFAYDTLSQSGPMTPEKEKLGAEYVASLRHNNPSKSDDEIIEWVKTTPQYEQVAAGQQPDFSRPVAGFNSPAAAPDIPNAPASPPPVRAPAAPPATGTLNTTSGSIPAPEPLADMYASRMTEINQKYGGEQGQAARDKARASTTISDAMAPAILAFRVQGNDPGAAWSWYNNLQKEIANRPIEDFQAQKADAIAQLQADLKTGELKQADAKRVLEHLTLSWALRDRADKETFDKAKRDPQSMTSTAYRTLFKEMAPDLFGKVPNAEQLSAEQIDKFMPTITKTYEERLKRDSERIKQETEQAGKKEVAEINAKGRVDAAAKKAEGSGQPTISNQIAGINTELNVDKELGGVNQMLIATQSTKRDLAKAEEILKSGRLYDGPGTELLNALPGSLQDKDRQELLRIQKSASNQILQLAKGAQTEGDAARAERLTNLANGPATLENLKKMQMEIAAEEQRLMGRQQSLGGMKDRVRAATTPSSSSSSSSGPKKVSSQAEYDALPSGSQYIRPDGQIARKK